MVGRYGMYLRHNLKDTLLFLVKILLKKTKHSVFIYGRI